MEPSSSEFNMSIFTDRVSLMHTIIWKGETKPLKKADVIAHVESLWGSQYPRTPQFHLAFLIACVEPGLWAHVQRLLTIYPFSYETCTMFFSRLLRSPLSSIQQQEIVGVLMTHGNTTEPMVPLKEVLSKINAVEHHILIIQNRVQLKLYKSPWKQVQMECPDVANRLQALSCHEILNDSKTLNAHVAYVIGDEVSTLCSEWKRKRKRTTSSDVVDDGDAAESPRSSVEIDVNLPSVSQDQLLMLKERLNQQDVVINTLHLKLQARDQQLDVLKRHLDDLNNQFNMLASEQVSQQHDIRNTEMTNQSIQRNHCEAQLLVQLSCRDTEINILNKQLKTMADDTQQLHETYTYSLQHLQIQCDKSESEKRALAQDLDRLSAGLLTSLAGTDGRVATASTTTTTVSDRQVGQRMIQAIQHLESSLVARMDAIETNHQYSKSHKNVMNELKSVKSMLNSIMAMNEASNEFISDIRSRFHSSNQYAPTTMPSLPMMAPTQIYPSSQNYVSTINNHPYVISPQRFGTYINTGVPAALTHQ